MKDLGNLSNRELLEFFNSFDFVLSDVDGVLWNLLESVPGTQDALKSLKEIGKKVILVSNNTTKHLTFYHKQLKQEGFDIDKEEVVTPILAIVSYLKKQNLKKEIFLLGMTPLRRALEEAGFKIAQNGPDRIEETFDALASNGVVDDGSVGAVVVDIELNLNYVNLQRAATYLERPEVLFVLGAPDTHLPLGEVNKFMIGPGYFMQILEDITKRQGVSMAKPSPNLNDYIVEKFGIKDRSRVLFVGDAISTDMKFAAECNYKKLLVLSGLTKKEALIKWEYPEKYKPEYYANSLKDVHEAIARTFACKM